MDGGKSITDAKAAFIRSQVRLLSAPLQPSAQWQDFAPETEESTLSNKVVQDVVAKVNDKIKQHNRMVFSVPSQRHVAEQIDILYWNSVTNADADAGSDAVTVKKAAELTSSETLHSLPEDPHDLPIDPAHTPDNEDSAKYEELQARLLRLSKRRDEQQSRLAQYRQLHNLLRPFENAQENIQPNLVTKDGELSKELDRMRILLARVTGRINEAKDTNNSTVKHDTACVSSEQKLAAVMDLT